VPSDANGAVASGAAGLAGKLDLDGEFFLIPYMDGYLFSAPRLNTAALIDNSVASDLRREMSADPLLSSTLLSLAAKLEFPAQWREIIAVPAPKGEWRPTVVTFSNTQKCTLRCKYCYADGGRLDDADIDPKVAEAAIDLIIDNALALSSRPGVIFIGEGEATANWDGFTHIVDYFRSKATRCGLEPFVSLSTNGIFSKNKVPYISANCDSLAISIDGLPEAHDAQRVLPNGKGSFGLIAATLREFDGLKKSYAIWSTVTQAGAPRLGDFIQWIGESTLCKEVHVDPVFDMSGLSKTTEYAEHFEGADFIEAYRLSRRIAASFGISLIYSPADDGQRMSFCGATNASNFLVTSKGLVTSCNEVLRADDPRAELFQYGKWDTSQGKFEFNSAAIAKLSKLDVQQIPKCQSCFAKYNCAGDCYARSSGGGTDPWAGDYTSRCTITRELLKDNILMSLLRD
jgi:uncharacterized protein